MLAPADHLARSASRPWMVCTIRARVSNRTTGLKRPGPTAWKCTTSYPRPTVASAAVALATKVSRCLELMVCWCTRRIPR